MYVVHFYNGLSFTSHCALKLWFIKNIDRHQYYFFSGVPQRTHLVSILFLIFINDITFLYSSKRMFADDIKLCRVVNCYENAALL